ncbi:hypothetical protein B5F34_16890 [Mediterranea sp. An20]|nr:hypothetical protein B5F34_16890 [Mediterranea sp. An20]
MKNKSTAKRKKIISSIERKRKVEYPLLFEEKKKRENLSTPVRFQLFLNFFNRRQTSSEIFRQGLS